MMVGEPWICEKRRLGRHNLQATSCSYQPRLNNLVTSHKRKRSGNINTIESKARITATLNGDGPASQFYYALQRLTLHLQTLSSEA